MTHALLAGFIDANVSPLVRCVHPEWQAPPLRQLRAWLEEALAADDPLADTMCLATRDATGAPNQRFLSFRGLCDRGLCFFSNYEGVKATELAAEPRAALSFYWHSQGRQLRVRGRVEKLPAAISDAYFLARPLGSRRTAVLSRQSRELPESLSAPAPLPDTADADASFSQRPATWGGYVLWPDEIEFWQRGRYRWHDRTVWSANAASEPRGWQSVRVYP